MKLNIKLAGPSPKRTFEGAHSSRISPLAELRRRVLTCLLWEDTFYEKGSTIAGEMQVLIQKVDPEDVYWLAVEAREAMYLRHVPLFLLRELARQKGAGPLVAQGLERVIQRPDELAEYLAIYWQEQEDPQKEPLSAGSKRGLAAAFRKFDAPTLAKYERDGAYKLRDVLRLTHPKPQDEGVSLTWKQVVARSLSAPDTWEVALSKGADKKETFERLLSERKLGGLAFLRNLRNMVEAGVNPSLMRERFAGPFPKVLPFRFIAALRHAPAFAEEINTAMLNAAATLPKMGGSTILLVDVSGSMNHTLSLKSDLSRLDAASALAVLVREVASSCRVFTFSQRLVEVENFRGLPLLRGIGDSQARSSTFLGAAIKGLPEKADRYIIITDEQSEDPIPSRPPSGRGYIINVAPHATGVGYGGWLHINGWSERVLDFILELEAGESAK